MAGPLALLCVLSMIGGWFALPLAYVFPASADHSINHLVEGVSIATPLVGLVIAWLVYYKHSISISGFSESSGGKSVLSFWRGGWGMDTLYNSVFVSPYRVISNALRGEWLDKIYHSVVAICAGLHQLFSRSQTGKMRWYVSSMVFGLIILVSIMGWAD